MPTFVTLAKWTDEGPQADPWIVAEVAGTTLCAVIAQWDDM